MTSDFLPSIDEPRGGESPLLDFWGTPQEFVVEDFQYEGNRNVTRTIIFHFIDVDVIDSIDPYPYLVAEIGIRYADPARSRGNDRWSYFAESLRSFFGRDPEAIKKLLHKRQHWKRIPKSIRGRVPEGTDNPAAEGWTDVNQGWGNHLELCWVVVEIEGIENKTGGSPTADGSASRSGTSSREKILQIADGRTRDEFLQAALSDPAILRDEMLVAQLTKNEFVPRAIELNLLSEDVEGKLHVVGGVS